MLGQSPFSAFTWFLVCLYFIGEMIAVRAKKLTSKRRLRQQATRKNNIQLEAEQKAKQEEVKAAAGVEDVKIKVNGEKPPKKAEPAKKAVPAKKTEPAKKAEPAKKGHPKTDPSKTGGSASPKRK